MEEKKNYEQEIFHLLNNKMLPPMSEEEMVQFLELKGKDIGNFICLLDEMEHIGKVVKSKRGKYFLPKELNLVVGHLSKHPKGFGFVVPEDKGAHGSGKDIFISSEGMANAMSGDRVVVKLLSVGTESRSGEGAVIKVLERGMKEVVGRFDGEKGFAFVVPDDRRVTDDIFVKGSNFGGAVDGDKVVAVITKYPEGKNKAEGKVVEVLGRWGDPELDVVGLLRKYKIPESFSSEVQWEAHKVPGEIRAEELSRRQDLRDQVIITIDGADAKDLDDAVSISLLPSGNYVLGVHIADVSHYVKEDSKLDIEGMKRGCSVYLIDTVIPMLPKTLSNGICSLNPNEDRLTLSIEMEINPQGKVVNHNIFESVIRSCQRMVYTDVSDMLEDWEPLSEGDVRKQQLISKYQGVYQHILHMADLAAVLRKVRDERGNIDFDIDEAYIKLDDRGFPVDVNVAERRVGNLLIEEFMLIANETIAEHFFWMESPFVYRVHEKPAVDKMEEFKKFLGGFGYQMKGNPEHVHPRVLSEIIRQVEGTPEEAIINRVMLRSMKKAYYDVTCDGHFGLSVKYYCHFTSPIRRYPDLIIHRIIKEQIHGGISTERSKFLTQRTKEAAEQASLTERRAIEIERDLEKIKKARYMDARIGTVYQGVISGVSHSGFYVEVEKTIEGMVKAESIRDDYYTLDQKGYRLVGERTRRVFGLGDLISVTVSWVDLQNYEIYFELL